jgi:hypothetical protein
MEGDSMNARRRLDRLEVATEASAAELHLALARLLGMVDGLLTPPRTTISALATYGFAVDAAREYHRGGLVFGSGDGKGRSHVADHRTRVALRGAGFVTLNNGKVQLTALGDRLGRVLCGVAVDHWLYQAIIDRLRSDQDWNDPRPGGWRSELDLFGRAGDQRDTEIMLPLLGAGLIESRSSAAGVVFYRSIDGAGDWVGVDVQEGYSEAAAEVYTAAYVTAIEHRQRQKYDGAEVFVPLSASR